MRVLVRNSNDLAKTTTLVVVLNVRDMNDTPVLTFTAENPVASVASMSEIASIGARVGWIRVSDEDVNDVLTTTLTDTTQTFVIIQSNQTTLERVTRVALDFETQRVYRVSVTTRVTASATATVAITVNVVDANEAPVVLANQHVFIDEDATAGLQARPRFRMRGPCAWPSRIARMALLSASL